MRKDKVRDVARSVLPSTARKGAREDKRNYHATHRHAQNQINHAICRHLNDVDDDGRLYTDVGLYDDFEDQEIFDGYSARTKNPSVGWDDMNEIVSNRRGHDKVAPLIRWAQAIEKRLMSSPPWADEDKIAYFKALLPDTLQGRHALGHVKMSLGLYDDPFYIRYHRIYTPPTIEALRAGVYKHLSTSKGRRNLRNFLLETVPVAGHTTTTNNKTLTRVQAVDENGDPRFLPSEELNPITGKVTRWITPRPLYVDVYIPQIVATTCEDCTFLRNDPLATTKAINRFVDIVWESRPAYNRYMREKKDQNLQHDFFRKIYDYVCEG